MLVSGQRFFGDDVTAGFHTFDDILVVEGIDGSNDDSVGFCLGDHFIEVGKGWAVCADVFFGKFDSAGVGVAKADKFHVVGVIGKHVFSPHIDCPDARAYDGQAGFLLSGILGESQRQSAEQALRPDRRLLSSKTSCDSFRFSFSYKNLHSKYPSVQARIYSPPLTAMYSPVMKPAASELARKRIALAMSSGGAVSAKRRFFCDFGPAFGGAVSLVEAGFDEAGDYGS